MSFQKGTNTKTYRNNLIIKHYFRPSKTIVSLKRHPPHLATTIHKQQSNGTFFSHLIFLYNLCQPSTSFNSFEDYFLLSKAHTQKCKCYTTAISTGHISTEMFFFIGNTIPLNRFMQGENSLCNIQYATVRMSLTFELIQVYSLF